MASGVEIRTADRDLGLTIALWIEDLVAAFFDANPSARVVIDDDGQAGRPFRKNVLQRRPDFRASRESDDLVCIHCTSSSIVLAGRPNVETARKLMVAVGVARDPSPIDHVQIIRQQQRIRRLTAAALGVAVSNHACRFLLRVDDFPSPFAGTEDFLRFHRIAREHELPYLLAVTPFFSSHGESRPLSDSDANILHACVTDGVQLALHGFTHVSRYRNYASELAGMTTDALRRELERADAQLRSQHLETIGFVAPFNAYDPLTFGVLAERFPLICGGPESVSALGYRAGPAFFMRSLYVPSYREAYDVTLNQPGRFDRTLAEAAGLTIPVTLHWANEVRDGFRSFRTLCERLRGRTTRWSDLVAAAADLEARCQCQ